MCLNKGSCTRNLAEKSGKITNLLTNCNKKHGWLLVIFVGLVFLMKLWSPMVLSDKHSRAQACETNPLGRIRVIKRKKRPKKVNKETNLRDPNLGFKSSGKICICRMAQLTYQIILVAVGPLLPFCRRPLSIRFSIENRSDGNLKLTNEPKIARIGDIHLHLSLSCPQSSHCCWNHDFPTSN